jgi:hypothetical protein
VEIGKRRDLTVNLHHVMDFSGITDFEAFIVNTDKKVLDYEGYLKEALSIKER